MRPIASLIAAVVVASSCGPGLTEQMAPTTAARPISVGQIGSAPIAFYRLIVDVSSGEIIGHHYVGPLKERQSTHRWNAGMAVASDEFRLEASRVMRDYGYQVLGGENLIFGKDEGTQAQYQLGGAITQLAFDTYNNLGDRDQAAAVGVDWQVLDTRSDSVIYTHHTRGHSRKDLDESGGVIIPAFRDALLRLLSDSAFVTLLTTRAEEPISREAPREVHISRCVLKSEIALPEGIDRAFRAVVVVRPGMNVGSGVIVSRAGHILTAAHVVSGLNSVPVRLRSGIQVDALVLASDPYQDVAVLKISGDRHDCLPVTTDRLGVGTDLFAIGSPRSEELSYSVSRGIVSGYRDMDGKEFVQTDASLNPGNSGGPLITVDGDIVGIVSWKFSDETEGIAFGVPIDAIASALRLVW